jgi:hypothetical protein
MSDPGFVQMLHIFIPEQIAADFSINQLSSEIVSFISSLALKPPGKMLSPKSPPSTTSGPGVGGSISVNKSEFQIHYLSSLKSRKGTEPLSPFARPCTKESYQQDVSQNSSLGRAAPPWATLDRPSELWTDQTRPTMQRNRGHCILFTETLSRVPQHIPRRSSAGNNHTKLHEEVRQLFHLPPGCGHLPTSHRCLVLCVSLLRVLYNRWDISANKGTLPPQQQVLSWQQGTCPYQSSYSPCRHGGGKIRVSEVGRA